MSSHTSSAQVLSLCTFIHGHHHGAPSLTRFSFSTSTCSSLSFSSTSSTPSCTLSSTTRSSWKTLCDSANNGCEDTYDVLYLPTLYEPNGHEFNELQNSSVPLSFKIPAADQDVDELTLGKMLTEAYRGQVDYFEQGGVSVSQLSSSARSDRSGQLVGEMVDRSGQPDECNSSKAQIRTLLEEQRQTIIAEYREKVSHHELQAAHAEEERRLLQGQLWQQKLEFREAHQRSLTEMEEL